MVHSDCHGGVASIIQGHDGHEHHCWDDRGVSTKKGVQMEWVYVCGVVHSCRLGRWRVYLLDSACTVTPTSPQHDQYSTTRLQPTSSRSPIIIVRLAQDDSLDQLYSLKVKCCCSNLAPGTRAPCQPGTVHDPNTGRAPGCSARCSIHFSIRQVPCQALPAAEQCSAASGRSNLASGTHCGTATPQPWFAPVVAALTCTYAIDLSASLYCCLGGAPISVQPTR